MIHLHYLGHQAHKRIKNHLDQIVVPNREYLLVLDYMDNNVVSICIERKWFKSRVSHHPSFFFKPFSMSITSSSFIPLSSRSMFGTLSRFNYIFFHSPDQISVLPSFIRVSFCVLPSFSKQIIHDMTVHWVQLGCLANKVKGKESSF